MKKTLAILILIIQSCSPNMLENLGVGKTSFNQSGEEYTAPTNQLNKTKELLDGASITFPTLTATGYAVVSTQPDRVLNKDV